MIETFIDDPVKTEFPILYKYTSKGQTQQWQIVQTGDRFYTIEGIVGGKLTVSLPTICSGKNLGKKNETTDSQQAYLEAKAKWQKKVDSGYNEVLTTEKKFFEPMLAHEYSKYPIKFDGKTRVFVQPKLDGLRAINDGATLMSRNGKPYTATPHLLHGEMVLLDGELYTHEYKDDFNKIVSLCKKQKPTEDELKESAEKVQYWVYDFPQHSDLPFSKRYERLVEFISNLDNESLVPVPTYEVKSEDEIKDRHAEFTGEGFEGTIVRIDALYECKRSKNLLKYKDFIDEEFKIVGYEEGTGGRTGTIGFFIMQHDTKPDLTFKSNVKGNFDYLKEVWRDRDSYIGKTATVKYFNRTPEKEDGTGGVPRFPYIIKINREEYE